jgi:hypothetical protein
MYVREKCGQRDFVGRVIKGAYVADKVTGSRRKIFAEFYLMRLLSTAFVRQTE